MSVAAGTGAALQADFIVVGGGTAGCVLANRLTADGRHQVLLLEAGVPDDSPWFRVPVGYRHTIGNTRYDWCYDGEPEPGLGGRVIRHPRGKVLGGSTAINGMVAIRGQAADYDAWRDSGLPGWGWADVLPYFKRSENHVLGASDLHGSGGPWQVDAPRVHWPVLDAVRQACQQAGIPAVADFNAGQSVHDGEGVGTIHVNQKNGRRWSAADGYLKPARTRANLQVLTGVQAQRLLFDGQRATGVAFTGTDGQPQQATARRAVVLAAGAFGSPQLLMCSGIGPADHLQQQGITPLLHLPGVGANLHDHLQVAARYRLKDAATLNPRMNSRLQQALMAAQFALTGTGPLTMAPCQLGLFAKSSLGVARADLGYNVLAFSKPAFDAPFDPFPGLTMIVYDLRPTSRGCLRLAGPSMATPPRILMNYLATDRDRQVAIDALRLTRRIMAAPGLAAQAPQEQWPGPAVRSDDDAALLDAVRQRAGTIYHPVGTARMGADGDADAVLDAHLRVRGVGGLWVMDASAMPAIPSGNTASPTVMLAEKGADLLLADAG